MKNLVITVLSILCVGLLALVLYQQRPSPATEGAEVAIEMPVMKTPPPRAPVDPAPVVASPTPALLPEAEPPAAPMDPAGVQAAEPPAAFDVAEMMKKPEFREMFRAQQKMAMDQTHGELFDTLELDPDDRNTMKQLLADRMIAMMEVGLAFMSREQSPEETQANAERAKEIKEAFDEDLRTFLGEEDFELFEQFEDTQPDRIQVDLFKQSLGSSDQLDWEQEHELILAMHEERKDFDWTTPMGEEQPVGMPSAEQAAAHLKDLRVLHQRYLDRAQAVLSTDQLDQFAASLEQFIAMQEMALKMTEKMFGRSAPPPE